MNPPVPTPAPDPPATPAPKPSRWRKILVWSAVIVLVPVAIFVAVVCLVSDGKIRAVVKVEVEDLDIPEGDGAAVERGRYLVDHLMCCKDCHGEDLGGREFMNNGAMGSWYAPNLTGGVVARHTGGDWAAAIRHGVAPNGRRLLMMPCEDYVNFSDEDLGAVVAYVRSMPRVERSDRPIRLGPIARMLVAFGAIRFAHEKIDHAAPRPEAKPGPTWEWGRVLVGSCTGCHQRDLSGGPISGGDPAWPSAANLTVHRETGIGTWTYADFARAMQNGRRPDGSEVRYPMPWKAYSGMREDDLKALWEYLRTVPPVNRKVR